MTDWDDKLTAYEQAAEAAHTELVRLCNGEQFIMRVPAQPNRDSDLLIGSAIDAVPELIAKVRELTAENKDRERHDLNEISRLKAQVAELTAETKQWKQAFTELDMAVHPNTRSFAAALGERADLKAQLSEVKASGESHCSDCECIHEECGYVVGSAGCVELHDSAVTKGIDA